MFRKIIFYITALLLLCLNIWFAQQSYYFFTHSQEEIIRQYLLENPNIYKPLVFKKFYFTPDAYKQSLIFVSIATLLCFLLNIFYWRYRTYLQCLYQEVLELCFYHIYQIRSLLFGLSVKQKAIVTFTLLSILGHQVYMYKHIFVAMDEAFSWLFFASQGVFVTVSNYPVPNNHVFYNLCSIFWSNFVGDQILAMRLTSILAFWGLLLLIFYYFLKTTNFPTALFALMLIGLGFSQAVFAVQGRGYMLVALCFLVALWSLQAYLQNYHKGYLIVFMKACFVGFWTIPVFLYVFLSFYAYLLFVVWRKKKQRKLFIDWFGVGVLIGALVYLCYCPILMYSGFSALAGNENVSPKTYDSAWFFGYILSISLRESVIYVVSLPKYVSFVVFSCLGIALLVLARKTQDKNFQFLWNFLLVSLPITFLVICLMQAFPFYRVWTYYAIFLAVLVAWLAYFFVFSRKKLSYVYLLLVNIFLLIGAHFQFWREIQDFYDPKAYQHHKGLEQATYKIMEKEQKTYLSIEAFYIRFWFEYANKTQMLRENPCKADVAVTENSEPIPICQEVEKEIWFLRFHTYKQKN